ncbi:hypothetical protein KCP78_01810 [Salmonella enterica subsp. enterica]|nr:hypothetical protein KCP78_01810 [Salmonella enterica subsp. enterica]
MFRRTFAGVVVDQDVGFRIDLRNARDHSFWIFRSSACAVEINAAIKRRGERHALHKTSGKKWSSWSELRRP